jgi:D-alanyl-D-alanine carboxypeptidase/D-alanyl-D-alanine-endopeptidase (penicillin-binding protein 4)
VARAVPRRLSLLLLALAVAVAWAAPSAQALTRAGLGPTLAKLHAKLGRSAGAYVVDAATGESLYAHRENLALAPASNEKLFVTAAALLRYGPNATLATDVRAAPGAVVDARGVLRGDLYLVGGGDPTLGDDGLRALADDVVAAGITRIDGALVGDESLFDALRGGPDSRFRYDSDLGGALGALSWRHGRTAVGNPAEAAVRRLGTFLKARGVRYGRRPQTGVLPGNALGAQEADPLLGSLASPDVGQLIADINIPSDNFGAEMLAKGLGAHFGAGGTTASGLAVVRDQLTTLGVHPRLVDGSGLSRANRTTARQVVRLLERMDNMPTASVFEASLPVAGRSGTLRKRMRRTAAAGRCAAKTGTLIGVSALSGTCTTLGGRRVLFSFLENRVCTSCAKKIEDKMVAAIARLRD